jgi:C1A family cysteine protease
MPSPKLDIAQINATLAQKNARWKAAPSAVFNLPDDKKLLRLGFAPPRGTPTLEQRENDGRADAAGHKPSDDAKVGAPAAYDLRNVGGRCFITPVRDQGNCGSCVAFGTLAAVEGTMRVQSGNADYAMDLSEAQLF